jgi:integrase
MEGLKLRKEVAPLSLGELWDAFERGLPSDMRGTGMEYLAKCKIMVRECLLKEGAAARALPVSVLSLNFAREWINLRAAFMREGGKRSYAQLREAGVHLKAVNPNLALPGTATINSILGRAQALVGEKSRMYYLTSLRLPLPPLGICEAKGLLQPKRMAWVPRGEHWAGMLKLLAAATEANETDFLVAFWLAATCGLRPIEILAVEKQWFEMQDNQVFLLVQNLKDDGSADRRAFLQKAGEAALSGRYPVCAELSDLVMRSERGFLFAPTGSPTARENLLRRTYSKRIREVVGDATFDTWYSLRKLYVSTVTARDGAQAGSLAARHASGPQLTLDHYVAPVVPLMKEVSLSDLG